MAVRSKATGEAFAKRFSVARHYDDYQALLNDKHIQAVYIGLPNHLHKEWIIRAAQAGKHILCEKPFVLNAIEAHEALAAVETAQVICMEALMYRHHPLIAKLKELVHGNLLGEIKLYQAVYTADIAALANTVAGAAFAI